jgi:hypothetical protein
MTNETEAVEETVHRIWCGPCGRYAYAGDPLPCSGKSPDCFMTDLQKITPEQIEEVTVSTKEKDLERIKKCWEIHHQKEEQQKAQQAAYEQAQGTWDDTAPPPPSSVKRSLVEEAMSITDGARRKAYGSPEDNFGRIADLWTAYLGLINPKMQTYLQPKDIALMMTLMKIARIIETPDHRDSYTDIIGYTLCGAEIAGVANNEVGVK